MSARTPTWRSLAEHEGDPAFIARVAAEFPGLARVLAEGPDRRQVLKLMGASLALGLGGCDPGDPKGRIIPGIKAPPGIVPGIENEYATASVLDGYATGIRVRHQAGRPMQVVGNPAHPASLGAVDPIAQARILSLYDPDRSHGVSHGNQQAGWASFREAFERRRTAIDQRKGDGLRILTGTVTSPTLVAQLAALQGRYPLMRWHQCQAVSRDAVRLGARLAYGRPVEAVYRLDRADVILAIDSDLLSTAPGHLRHARDVAGRRNPVAGPMSRVYAVESTPDLIGVMADHRFVAGPREIHQALTALAAAILRQGSPQPGAPAWLAAVAQDLAAHPGRALIHIGPQQPAEYHALVHALNEALGGRGRTFDLIEPVEAAPIDQATSLGDLIADMADGRIQDLLILGENPVFTAPPAFAEALKQVPFSVSLGVELDETAQATTWHLPEAHPLEAWSDARAYDGTVTILQPQVQPLFGAHSAHEVLALLAGDRAPDGYAIVRATWAKLSDDAWHGALSSGVVSGTAGRPVDPPLRSGATVLPAPPDRQITLLLRPDPYLWDGRFANSAWLQELPRPLTKLVWDNPLLVASALARRLGVGNGDLVKLSAGGATLTVPVWIQPGQAEDCVTAHRGWGRRQVGAVGKNAGFDFLALGDGPLSVEKAGGTYALATTEHHNPLDAAPDGVVRHGTLAGFTADRQFLQTPDPQASLYPPQPAGTMAWGMSIDLNACIGCNACVIACQAENNVPVVGKDEVLREREMHWLRIDRYFEGSVEAPRVLLQPMLCMHCEEAPCEVVCPVGATVHDAEGLNVMVYNRCVGTRFCSNNCPYKVRRFNYFAFARDEVRSIQARNQEVSVRARGVMEKCSFCIQRIAAARIDADKEDRAIRDGEVVTACQAACPTQAISFGNIRDQASAVARRKASPLAYALLGELNTKPRVTYEGRVRNANPAIVEPSA
ncbi:MAG TPA: TAT-variant-translocated molybdopterin oxidoreductase [Aliidongia sp.]|uniref:TAT-variant-translocated molybdopterin oxidoreductase n=1 Tax=Aliidongia sp. TaxID=1914230 RepID=UPI002DDD3CB6|nr:TAT-variant-translocated molybdopterin oxidoreductase [Aliidongia sp.]HEV2673251.1 TAT-variant-translocated molybdopterin oxidoreductase [Aliidongia sp.]